MRYGIITDIHEDFTRLKSAINILDQKQIDKLVFLGDVVDPDSVKTESLDLIMKLNPIAVSGNHDDLVLICNRYSLNEKQRNYLENLPGEIQLEEGILLTHANPLEKARNGKGRWYRGSYIHTQDDAKEVLENTNHRIILIGHTHIPKVLWKEGSENFSENGEFELKPGERYILNPGAVGYSRDSNPAISCAVLDTDKYVFEVLRIN